MSLKRRLDQIRSLAQSDGWSLVQDAMRLEIERATVQITEPRPIPLQDLDFRRGAIWAARLLTDLPLRLASETEFQILVEAERDSLPNQPQD